MQKLRVAGIAGAAMAACSSFSFAADLGPRPIVKAPMAAASPTSNVYLWADGSYQSVNLPAYALGWRTTVFPSVSYTNYANSFDPRPTGYGISGGIGYVFQESIWPSWMGRNVRVEIGGSYVQANDTQSGIGPSALEFASQAVNGVTSGNVLCAALCYASGRLQTDYDSWRINGKIAGDHTVGGVTVTPSMSLFGGHTDVNQRLSQSLINTALGPLANQDYVANSSLQWTEWGAKLGLNATIPLGTGGFALGLGGSTGVAYRDTELSASNQIALAALPASTLAADSTRSAFLANLETSLMYRPRQAISLRVFAGLNFDSDVPGIAGPVPPAAFAAGVQATPASIKFESETSYYAGGGLTVKF